MNLDVSATAIFILTVINPVWFLIIAIAAAVGAVALLVIVDRKTNKPESEDQWNNRQW